MSKNLYFLINGCCKPRERDKVLLKKQLFLIKLPKKNKTKRKDLKKKINKLKLWFFLSLKFRSFKLYLGTSARYKLDRRRFFYYKKKRKSSYRFSYKKPRLLVNEYLLSKTNSLVKKKYKFPFVLNHLTFTQPFILSTVKNILSNPFFGSVRKGTYKGFYQTLGIKEKTNFYLVSRWYRLQRFAIYQRYWKRREKTRFFVFGFVNTETFFNNIQHYKNFIVFCHFFIRKRWNLLEVVNL